jgi:hypothetical protein
MSDQPFLSVVRGNPALEEIAALVAVLTARTTPPPEPEPRRTPWSNPSHAMRRPLPHGPGAWRSAL